MKKLNSFLISIALLFFAASTIYASGESTCQVVYGGGEVCGTNTEYTINKLVQTPGATKGGNSEYVENLTINDSKYAPGQNVNFKIVVENIGDSEITNMTITDRFPDNLTFVAGAGVTDEGAKEISFTLGSLGSGETQEYVITAKIADSIASSQSIVCVTNNVKSTTPDASAAEDNAQLCIETSLVEKPTVTIAEKPTVEKIPATGPEMAILFGLIPAGAAGYYLRKKTN